MARDGTTSTPQQGVENTQQEIADGTDASTTASTVQNNLDAAVSSRTAPADIAPEVERSTFAQNFGHGWEANLMNRIPSILTTATTGGGAVQANRYGTQVRPGGTAGDWARLQGITSGGHENADTHGILVDGTLDFTGQGPPSTDEIYVGFTAKSDGIDGGCYIDLLNGQACVSTTTEPIPVNKFMGFRILKNSEDGYTDFWTWDRNGRHHVRINDISSASDREHFVDTISNGADEYVHVLGGRQWRLWEVPDL